MKYFPFVLAGEDGLIIVNAIIENEFNLRMAIDTGASHSSVNSKALYLAGHELKESIGEVEVETANGIIIVECFEIKKLECFDIIKENFIIQVFDFLTHGITSEYDGIIGLDFFRNHKICFDFHKMIITIDS